MKRSLCILLFCALLAGCGLGTGPIQVDRDEPIRIVAVAQSVVPVTATPLVTATPTLPPTKAPTPEPTATPEPTDTPEPEETPVPTATPDLPLGQQLVMVAQEYLNYYYGRGGHAPETGFDPGGFVYWCLRQMGQDVPRRTAAGYAEEDSWTKITRFSDLQPGDLLFFKTGDNENINCVCIYLGDNRMIYPSTSKQSVIASDINSYWTNAFQWARRVF